MALATLEAIRDQALTKIEALTPTTLPADRFRRHRAERDGRLEDWAEAHITACLRRVSAREIGPEEGPLVSDFQSETVRTVVEVRIAYPQTHRYGKDNARDRDDVIREDWKKIKYAISGDGGAAKGNFTTATADSYDCTPLVATMEFDRAQGVDYLVCRWPVEYQRSTA